MFGGVGRDVEVLIGRVVWYHCPSATMHSRQSLIFSQGHSYMAGSLTSGPLMYAGKVVSVGPEEDCAGCYYKQRISGTCTAQLQALQCTYAIKYYARMNASFHNFP